MTIASGLVLTLDNSEVSGGIVQLDNSATISVSGNSEIENASLNNGGVSIAAGQTLTLDGTTVTGSTITNLSTTSTTGIVKVDSGQTLTLAGVDTVTGGVLAIAFGPAQAAAGNSVLFSPVEIDDLNSGANPLTLTIQASSGSFAAISGSGVTQSGDEITIVGDLTDINNALDNGFTYTPATGVTSNTPLMLSVTDELGDAAFRTISINTSTPTSPTTTNLSASGEITNAGLIDITGTATLSSDAVFNTGTVKIESGEQLTLDDSKIYGGTVTDNATLEITGFSGISGGAQLNIGAGGRLTIDPAATLGLAGTINGTTGATITDSGVIDVGGSSAIIGGAQLSGGQVIVAAGASLALNNVTVSNSTVTIDNTSANVSGLVTVSSGDALTLAGTDIITGGLFAVGSSDPQAGAASGSVYFSSIGIDDLTAGANPSVTLTIQASSGSFSTISGTGVTVDGDLVTITGLLSAVTAALSGGLTYTPVGSSNTLTLSVADGSGDTAFRTLSVNTTNPSSPSNTISAASGEIKNAGLIDVTAIASLDSDTLLNGTGTVKVEASAHLTLDDSRIYNGTITNLGTIEVIGVASIASDAVLTNTGALMIDTASKLKLSNGTITGGTIADGGIIDVSVAGTIGGAQLSGGQVTVEAGSTLTLDNDTVTPTGATFSGTTASIIDINMGDTLTLNGVIQLSGGVTLDLQDSMITTSNSGTLDNENSTITGSGSVGSGTGGLDFVNDGTVDAAGTGAAISLDTGYSLGLTNDGLMEAVSGATLRIEDVLNNSGTVLANGGTVALNSASIGGTGTYSIAGNGTLEVLSAVNPNVNFTGAGTLKIAQTSYIGTVNSFSAGDIIDLAALAYNTANTADNTLTWTQNGTTGTLAISNGTQTEDITLAGTYTSSDFMLTPDSSGANAGTDAVFNSTDYWGSLDFPSQLVLGAHLQGGDVEDDTLANVISVLYSSVEDYSTSDPTGPYSVTRYVGAVDPFFLPILGGVQTVEPATQLTLPAKSKLILVNVQSAPDSTSVSTEGISAYVTQVAGSNIIDQVIATPNANDTSLTIGSPSEIGSTSNTGATIYNLDLSGRSDLSTPTSNIPYLTTYAAAWDQYNATAGTYSIDFQIFYAPVTTSSPGTASSPVETPLSSISSFNGENISNTLGNNDNTNLPAWEFRSGGGIYTLAMAELSSGKDVIEFQGFNVNGAANQVGSITGTISGTTLDVTGFASGTTLAVGDAITGTNIAAGTTITAFGTGTGGDGTYAISTNDTVSSAETMSVLTNGSDLGTFTISPNLSFYTATDANAVNEITQDVIPSLTVLPGSPSQQLNFEQVSATNDNDWVIGWNETVVDSTNNQLLGDQVEFVIDRPGTGLISITLLNNTSTTHFTAQLNDAQNVHVASYTSGSDDFVVLAYGDGTATHLVEFEISNNGSTASEVAAIVDPTTTAFTTLVSLGNGLFALEYDNVTASSETSLFNYQIFDFGTSGIDINDLTLDNGQNQYVLGTSFADLFTGESNVNNLYYYIGEATTTGIGGPADSFTGGNPNSYSNDNGGSNGWNIAVFSDERSDYAINNNGLVTDIISNGGDPAHTGTLSVSNVQILAFDPVNDPTPQNGTIDVTGGTYVILGQQTTPLTIEAGATAELDITASGASASSESVTFATATGTLVIDQPQDFSGTISGISGRGDVLDLVGYNTATTVTPGSFTDGDTILTVSDPGHAALTITLVGNYSGTTWQSVVDASDTGVDIFDPPPSAATIATGLSLDCRDCLRRDRHVYRWYWLAHPQRSRSLHWPDRRFHRHRARCGTFRHHRPRRHQLRFA